MYAPSIRSDFDGPVMEMQKGVASRSASICGQSATGCGRSTPGGNAGGGDCELSQLGRIMTKQPTTTTKKGSRVSKPGKGSSSSPPPSQQRTANRSSDTRMKGLTDWRTETLARVRALIQQADPDVVEDVKWRKPSNSMAGVAVWSHGGIICTGEMYKHAVKLTFARGASLADPAGLFNSSLEGNTRRAIDLHEGDTIHEKAFTALIRAAMALNTSERTGGAAISRPTAPVRSQRRPKRV